VTAFLSVASKAAGFVVLLRVLEPFLILPAIQEKILLVVAVLAGASLVLANLAAIPQTNFKRLLAYSSVAHAGYLLMAVATVQTGIAGPTIAFYLTAYLIMTMLAFAVMIAVSNAVGADNISDFNGLGRRSPFLAACLTLAVLSMAGLPFTAGFFAKFFLFQAAIAAGLFPLVILGAGAVACGFYYYLKVVRAMYWMPVPGDAATAVPCRVSWPVAVLLAVLAILTLVLGVYPTPVFALFY
jgi:NADH-quinone oxidoreductase subunit N